MHLTADDLLSPLHIDEKLHVATNERQADARQINVEKVFFRKVELQGNGRDAQQEVHHHTGHRHQEDFNGSGFSPIALLSRSKSSWSWTPQGPQDWDQAENYRKEEE